MKKNTQTRRISLGLLALASMVLFAGASIWEGAAAVSSGGDLPDSGFYIATNSFPRNTVVDITNLENGKSIKVIVSAGIDSPGLLAIVSRESALAIGLQNRAIGRIRMSQPSDPIAYARLSEDALRSGDPDYDPEAALRAYGDRKDSESVPEPAVVQAAPGKKRTGDAAPSGSAGSIDTAAPAEPIAESEPFSDPFIEEPFEEPFIEETVAEVDSGPRDIETPDYDYPGHPETEIAGTIVETGTVESPPASSARHNPYPEHAPSPGRRRTGETHTPPPNTEDIPAETAWFIPDSPQPEPESPPEETYALVPAPERPPETTDATMPDSRYFVGPIEGRKKAPETAPVDAAAPELSIPVVGKLEEGKYYLQIGAFEGTVGVESEVKKLGKVYPMLVQKTYAKGKLVHRVLVGPVNHGESGALLQRFRDGGYRNAFIRTSKTP